MSSTLLETDEKTDLESYEFHKILMDAQMMPRYENMTSMLIKKDRFFSHFRYKVQPFFGII